MTQHWILKTEPSTYAFADLAREGVTRWDGVRNHQAQKNMRAMALGDWVLIYHSVGPKTLVGLGKIVKTAYPDPANTGKESWSLVDVGYVGPLVREVSLAEIKADPSLTDIALVRQGRLSVMPVTPAEFATLMGMAETPLP